MQLPPIAIFKKKKAYGVMHWNENSVKNHGVKFDYIKHFSPLLVMLNETRRKAQISDIGRPTLSLPQA